MRIYLSVGIGPTDDIAPLQAMSALLGIPLRLSDVGGDGRRWLTVQGDIAEDKLHQIVASVDWP